MTSDELLTYHGEIRSKAIYRMLPVTGGGGSNPARFTGGDPDVFTYHRWIVYVSIPNSRAREATCPSSAPRSESPSPRPL